MKDTVQELLKPRYKVIADYPNMIGCKIGDVLELEECPREWWTVTFGVTTLCQMALDKYPHLFKPLAWWEEREASEMPEYVRNKESRKVEKVLSWSDKEFIYEKESTNPIIRPNVTVSFSVIHYYEPATEADYNQYLNNHSIYNLV